MTGALRRRARSFAHAFRGVALLVREEPNARIHLVATVAVLALGFALDVTRTEWALLALAIAAVWAAEACNTAIESLGDAITREADPAIGRAKDCAAAAVLLAALGAAGVGVLVLGRRLLAWAVS